MLRFFSVLIFLLPVAVSGQFATTPTNPATTRADSLHKPLQWRNIGPYRGGRANAIAGVNGLSGVYYTGYTGGGVWKTEDGGLTWRNISDGFFKTSSIGDIAVAASDRNVIYAGTGEHAVRGVMTSFGDGVYKSTDAGRTWKNMGLKNSRHIADVIIHPADENIVWVAAQGTVHGPNNERGVYKSTDGGVNWKRTLFINDSTGISSLTLDVTNPRVLYAASWQHQRLPWTVNSGGRGSSLWKSTDGGETWTKINKGLPSLLGKMGIAVSAANPQRVFAIVEAEKGKGGLYRSDDGGASWALQSTHNDIVSRSWYYMEVAADPKNENVVYVLNAPLMKSIDGGKTFAPIRVGHGDTHDLWINPDDPQNMALADDGGGEITFNGGRSWSTLNNQPTAQFYRVSVDNRVPYRLYGGQQDNTSVMIKSRTNSGNIGERDWEPSAGCESAWLAFDPANPEKVYGGCYQGYIEEIDANTGEGKDIQAYPSLNLAVEPRKMKYRFNWNAPIVASPHNPQVIYHAANVLLKTTNGGQKWEVISPDLTRNDTAKQGAGGGPITNEGAGGENYNTIYYVIESPLEKDLIWTGSDDGLVHLTRDGGKTWKAVTPPNLPEGMINSIEVSPHQKGTAYIAVNRYKLNDYGAYAFKTTDYGATWQRINNGIEQDDFLKVIREDRKVPNLLYGGAERGFYISYNGGAAWQRFQLNLPVVPVTDLALHNNDLIAATAGRAFWILDDLSSLQQNITASKSLKLAKPRASYKMNTPNNPAAGVLAGRNPAEGVLLDYWLPSAIDSLTQELTLTITTPSGEVLRTYSSKRDSTYKAYPGGPPAPAVLPIAKGLNRFSWDGRTATIGPDVPEVFIYGDYRGYKVAPGTYKATLQSGSEKSETEITILPDPAVKADAAAWAAQQALLKDVTAAIGDMHTSVNDVRRMKQSLQQYNTMLKAVPGNDDVIKAGQQLMERLTKWENNIVETRIKNGQDVINWPSKLNAELFNVKSLADAHAPQLTEGIKQRSMDLQNEWQDYKRKLNNELQKEIEAYNQLFRAKNLPALMLPSSGKTS